jgi:leucyl aminopeptidase
MGGMLVAGLFLAEFVGTRDDGERIPWAHLDIAGPAFNTGSPHGYTPAGGTGVAVRTLLRLLEDVAANGV